MASYLCLYDFEAGAPAELTFKKGDTLTLVEKKTESWWKCRDGTAQVGMVPSPYLREAEPEPLEERPSLTRGSSRRSLSLQVSSLALGDARRVVAVSLNEGGFRIDGVGDAAAVKGGAELVAFDGALRRVADDDGLAAIAASDVLFDDGLVEAAAEGDDAPAIELWLGALLAAPALAPLALAFVTGGRVSGEFEMEEGAKARCVVLYDFSPASNSELALVAGEVVYVDVAGGGPGEPGAAAVEAAAVDGWVKGVAEASGLAGYFPLAYVAVEEAAKPPPPPSPKRAPDRSSRAYSMKSLGAFDDLMKKGIALEDLEPGRGRPSAPGDAVAARCTASAWDGGSSAATPFASTAWDGETALTLVLGAGRVCAGLEAALAGLKPGGSRRATVSPALAYGDAGHPPDVAPGAFVIYEVELVSAAPASDPAAAPAGPLALVCRPAKGPAVEGGRIDAFDIGRSRVELLPTVHE